MTQQMNLKLDGECRKIKDQRIERVMSGKLSLQAFCLTIRPDDVFVLDGDTIKALSPKQWYAMHPVKSGELLSKSVFENFLAKPPQNLTSQDTRIVDYIKIDSKTCPSCRYRKHKETVWKLIKKYGYPLPPGSGIAQPQTAKYPPTTDEVQEKLDLDPSVFAGIKAGGRVECIDCVEKHVAQAYVLACETLNGYADYLPLVVGHLCEALAELPSDMKQLKSSLETCLAMTNKYRIPFVPLFAIMPWIDRARNAMEAKLENIEQGDSGDIEIDFTQDMHDEIAKLDKISRAEVDELCKTVRDSILRVENLAKVQHVKWEGAMAALGDKLAQLGATKTAAMVRARRLMFVPDPLAAESAGYSVCDDICAVQPEDSSEGL